MLAGINWAIPTNAAFKVPDRWLTWTEHQQAWGTNMKEENTPFFPNRLEQIRAAVALLAPPAQKHS